MPELVKHKYQKDFIGNQARSYLFEIQIAWHFFRKGYKIQWHENNSLPHSEFLVKSPDFEFNVECKRISVDASRRIRRRDFYRLADKIIPQIQRQNYSGSIDIILKEKLHGNDKFLDELSSQVISKINTGKLKGNYKISLGSLDIDLESTEGVVVDLNYYRKKLSEKKPLKAYGVIFQKSKNGKPVDPVVMTIQSEKPDTVLEGIRDRISEAAKIQLEKSKPGFIVCFLEEINDFRKLANNSGLQLMTNSLFYKDKFSHIVAVGYSSELLRAITKNTEEFFNEKLVFQNPNCKFKKARNFKF
ncbi:hypothetical protein KAS42_05450 [bacterium]|nr:hypothetical protein [bacterium]